MFRTGGRWGGILGNGSGNIFPPFGNRLAGELLNLAAELLREGLHTAEILEGYRAAYIKAQEILPSLVCHTVTDVRNAKQLAFAIKTVIGSKQYGFEVRV